MIITLRALQTLCLSLALLCLVTGAWAGVDTLDEIPEPELSCQERTQERAADAGYIPTAGFADLMGELSDSDSTLEFALVSPEQFVEAMAKLGISDASRVVLYDANYSVWAARVWWMRRWVGFDRGVLLDGGLTA